MNVRNLELAGCAVSLLLLEGCAFEPHEGSQEQEAYVHVESPTLQPQVSSSGEPPSEYTDSRGVHWVGGPIDLGDGKNVVGAQPRRDPNFRLDDLDDAAYAEAIRPVKIVMRPGGGRMAMRYLGSPMSIEKIAHLRKQARNGGGWWAASAGSPTHELLPPGLESRDAFTKALRTTLDPSEAVGRPSFELSDFWSSPEPKIDAIVIFDPNDTRQWWKTTPSYQYESSALELHPIICTATMIGSATAVTAAHCWYIPGFGPTGPQTAYWGRQHYEDLSNNVIHDTYLRTTNCWSYFYPSAWETTGSEELDYSSMDFWGLESTPNPDDGCHAEPAGSGTNIKWFPAGYSSYAASYSSMNYITMFGYDTNYTGTITGSDYYHLYSTPSLVTRLSFAVNTVVQDPTYSTLARHILDSEGGASGAGVLGKVLNYGWGDPTLYWTGHHLGNPPGVSAYNYMHKADPVEWAFIQAYTWEQ